MTAAAWEVATFVVVVVIIPALAIAAWQGLLRLTDRWWGHR